MAHKKAKPGSNAKTKNSHKPVSPHIESEAEIPAKKLERERNPFKRFFKMLGPGFITGAADDDPSGIGTYAVAGARFGFVLLWLSLLTFPLMFSIQFICGKIGMVSGMGLAGVLRNHYSRWLLYPAVAGLFIANTINAGTDIGAVAAAINLLFPRIPIITMIIPVTLVILVVQIWGSYRTIERIFKWLALALLAYIGAAFFAKPDWMEILRRTFIPTIRFENDYLTVIVAILGTTISPYLWFWQADQEVEEEISLGRSNLSERQGATNEELKYEAVDTGIGMFFSNIVWYFIILATAATLFAHGQTHIESATDAAKALEPLAGKASSILLAIGLIGSGFLAIPILTGAASFAVSEAFGWKCGLDEKPYRAKAFYAVIAISTLIGMLINFIGINPISALFWTAVINGLLAPPLLVLIMFISNNKKVMGDHANGIGINVMGGLTTAIMLAAAIGMLVTWQ